MTVGSRLKKLRENVGMNQAEIAKSLEMATSTYQHYERDESEITQKVLTSAITKFNISPLWLLIGEGEMLLSKEESPVTKLPDEVIGEVMKLMENLDEQGRQAVLLSARQADRIVQLERKLVG